MQWFPVFKCTEASPQPAAVMWEVFCKWQSAWVGACWNWDGLGLSMSAAFCHEHSPWQEAGGRKLSNSFFASLWCSFEVNRLQLGRKLSRPEQLGDVRCSEEKNKMVPNLLSSLVLGCNAIFPLEPAPKTAKIHLCHRHRPKWRCCKRRKRCNLSQRNRWRCRRRRKELPSVLGRIIRGKP